MSKKPIMGLSISLIILGLLGGLYTNCQPIGEGYGKKSGIGGGPSSGDDNDSSGDDGGSNDAGVPLPQTIWTNTVLPVIGDFNNPEPNKCSSCHTFVFRGGNGNLNIYNYDLMKALAAPGPTSSDNPYVNKIKNIIPHDGGNLCPGDVGGSVSPCKEISDWILAEFPLLTNGKAGKLNTITLDGRLDGWVADPLNINVPVEAFFYLGGPVGIGVLAGSQIANLQGPGATNGHYFSYNMPAVYTDGQERELHVYAVSAVAGNDIPSMQVPYQGFQPQPLGSNARNAYENDLRPRLNQCMGCHQVDYSVHWSNVGNPTPLNGGTSTNNELIDYMNGQNNHSGGGFCGGNKNNEPCASVQRWWQAEFGQ